MQHYYVDMQHIAAVFQLVEHLPRMQKIGVQSLDTIDEIMVVVKTGTRMA